MRIVVTVIGLVLVALTLRDIVHELFDPEDVGSMSRFVMRASWRVLRRLTRWRPPLLYHAGHIILLAVAAYWTVLLTIGWTLVYWPWLPEHFHIAPGIPPADARGFLTTVYFSLTALTTEGSSDIAPLDAPLRIASAFEGLVGVAMITSWITWVLSIYPVLSRRRSLERHVSLFRGAQPDAAAVVSEIGPEPLAELLRSFAEQLLHAASDLSQSRVTYYFQNRRPEISLSRQLPYLLSLGRVAATSGSEVVVRHEGRLLARAVESMLGDIGEQFLDMPDASPEELLRALAEDHLDREALSS